MTRLLTIVLLFLIAGCRDNPTQPPVQAGDVVIQADEPFVTITNNSSKPLFTFIVGKNLAALLDWVPCVDADECPPIPPNSTAKKAYTANNIDASETEALVYWWHVVVVDGEPGHTEIQQAQIRVR